MKKRTAEEVLEYIIHLFMYYLAELQESDEHNLNPFAHGEKTAFVECLEIIQDWEKAEEYDLDFDIESKFPI